MVISSFTSAGRPIAAALGYFDGVHRGHAAVLAAVVRHKGSFTPTAVTFDELPRKTGKRLSTPTVQRRVFLALGIEKIERLCFAQVREMPPDEFVRYLKSQYRAGFVSCGYDFRFGKGAAGDVELLRKLCAEQGMDLEVIPPVVMEGQKVSSTRIRELLRQGDMENVNRLLTSPYEFDFPVCLGDERGRTWGFPTINQLYDHNFALPRFGVYASATFVDGSWMPSVTNIGVRPMFQTDYPIAETYILNYSGDLYGQDIPVRLHAFLRGEKRFENVDKLLAAIRQNAESAQNIFKQYYT